MNTYLVKLMIYVDGAKLPHKAEVMARDREDAQEMAIEWAEACNLVHGEIQSIRLVGQAAAPVAEFVGMSDVDGEQFAHYRNVAL